LLWFLPAKIKSETFSKATKCPDSEAQEILLQLRATLHQHARFVREMAAQILSRPKNSPSSKAADWPMMSETYTLTAFDVETGNCIFEWPNVFAATRDRPRAKTIVIGPDDRAWRVVGLRVESTEAHWCVDVMRTKL
jgi:hypothetical protein